MKNTFYNIVIVLCLVLTIQSCSEELDYKAMNITHHKDDINVKEFIGDLTADIIVKNVSGEVVDEVDMGETIYIVDNTLDGVTERSWSITQDNQPTITSTEKLVRLNRQKPGEVTLSVTSKRGTDNAEVTSSKTIVINQIPVSIDYSSNPLPDNGKVQIMLGESVEFLTQGKGAPTIFSWNAYGPNDTYQSDERDAVIQFKELGLFDVAVKAEREDNPGEFVAATETKNDYVEVIPMDMRVYTARYSGGKITLEFMNPISANIADLASKFSIRIQTASGSSTDASISRAEFAYSDEHTNPIGVILSVSESIYMDDQIYVSTIQPILDQYELTEVTTEDTYTDYNEGMTVVYDFEDEAQTQMKKAWDSQSPFSGYSAEQARSGKYSYKIEIEAGGKNDASSASKVNNEWIDLFDLPEEGTYLYTYWMYLDLEGDCTAINTWILPPTWAWNKQCWQTGNNRPVREWFKIEQEVVLPTNAGGVLEGISIMLRPPNGASGVIYYDDISLVPLKKR